MSEQTFPKRDWISAQASYGSQALELLRMVDTLTDQLASVAPTPPRRVAIIAIGASHAAAASAVYQMRCDGIDACRLLPSERPDGLAKFDGLALYISQSGRSAEVVALAAEQHGHDRLAITNYHPSPLGALCPAGLNLGNLSDSSVSFVSFTGTLLALGLLTDRWKDQSNADAWKQLIATTAAAVEQCDDQLQQIAQMLVACPTVDFVAPAPLMSVAEEAALMLREGPRIYATAMETRQYLHGPMDAAGTGAHVVVGGTREALLVRQLSERSRNLVYITGHDADLTDLASCHSLSLPVSLGNPVGFAIASSFVMQKLVIHTAALRNIDINEPAFVRLDTKTDRVGSST